VAIIASVILSTTAIFIRYLTQEFLMPPLVLAFWREVLVGLTVLIALGIIRPALLRVARVHLPQLVFHGLVLALFNGLWTLSVALNGAAISTVLVYSSAAFTALLGRWLLREPLGWVKATAVAGSLTGCALVSGAMDPQMWRVNLVGIVAGVLSGLLYAVYSLLGRSASLRGLNPWTTLLYTFSAAALFLFPACLLPLGRLTGSAYGAASFLWLGGSLVGWVILFLLAAGPTAVGYGLYNVSLSYLPSSVANLILTTEPVFTSAFAFVLLGERLTWVQIGGSALVLGGVLLIRSHEVATTQSRKNAPLA
jgi:drug/metabolite transporter (DMT)-like permease